MNLFVHLLVRISSSYCTKPSRDAEIVVLYEYDSNFDKSDNEDSLYKIELYHNREKKYEFLLNSSSQKPFFNHDRSKRYEHFSDDMSKEIIKNTANAADIVYYQSYNFIFANSSKKEKRSYKTYVTGGPYGLKNDTEYIFINHIEKNIRSFLNKRLLHVTDFCSVTKKETLLNSTNFKLQFFDSYSDCIESLDNFLDFFNCFQLVKDGVNTKPSTFPGRKKNSITVSELRIFLKEKIDDHLKDVKGKNDFYNAFYSNKSSGSKIYQFLCEHLETRLLSREVFLPILKRDESINSYIQLFFEIILLITEKYMLRSFGLRSGEVISNESLKKDFNAEIDKLSETEIDKIFNCELDYVCHLFFSKRIKICGYVDEKNKFIIELEKLICDYYNTIECIMKKDDKNSIVYIEPIVFKKTSHKIIKALEIKMPNCNKIKCVKFFDSGDRERLLEAEDYIFTNNKLYLMLNVVKELNIKKIEFFSDNGSLVKKVNIDERSFQNMDSVLETTYDTTQACTIS